MNEKPESWFLLILDEMSHYYLKHGLKPTEIIISSDVVKRLMAEFILMESTVKTTSQESKILGMDVFEVSNRTNFVRIL